MAVSVGTTALSATIIVLLTMGAGVAAGTANVLAVLCEIGQAYVAYRRWAWRRDGGGDIAREVAPFWTMSLLGLVLSTLAVARVARLAATWPATERAVALPAANLTTFALLWIVQFFVLDRVIFRDRASSRGARRDGADLDTKWELS
jgi:putative flippase GtrA